MVTNDTHNTWLSLSAATERALANKLECNRAQHHERREENESEKEDDETVRREVARIEARITYLNWIYFALHGYPQRH